MSSGALRGSAICTMSWQDIQIHLAPILLGDGRSVFNHIDIERVKMECTRVIESPDVTHLRFRVVK